MKIFSIQYNEFKKAKEQIIQNIKAFFKLKSSSKRVEKRNTENHTELFHSLNLNICLNKKRLLNPLRRENNT